MKLMKSLVPTILAKARDIVAARWVKGHYVSSPGGGDKADYSAFLGIPDDDEDDWGYCGDGALRRAIKNEMKLWREKETEIPSGSKFESLLYDCQKALAAPIDRRITDWVGKRSHQKMWCFNDLPSTTKEDILAVYDEAIAEECEKVRNAASGEGMGRKD